MDNLFNNILANVSADITIGAAIITMLVAVIFGAAIGFTYYKTQEENWFSVKMNILTAPVLSKNSLILFWCLIQFFFVFSTRIKTSGCNKR